jgi:SUMO ligase MMS21 Smc5/6 complex component
LANALEHLLTDKDAYEAQQLAADDAIELLKAGDERPSDVAAKTILSLTR